MKDLIVENAIKQALSIKEINHELNKKLGLPTFNFVNPLFTSWFSIYCMEVGDLVWVRFMSIVDSMHVNVEAGVVWKLGLIIDDSYFEAGLYKIYVPEYGIMRKFFITDMRLLEQTPTNYETDK